MRRILINVLLLVVAFTIQNCVFPLIPFLSATPNLLLILTFSFGFVHGKSAGMYYGLVAGILLDLFYSGPFGFYTLLFVNIGYFNGICTKYYYEDYITLPLILSLVNEFVYNFYIYVLRFLIRNRLDILYYVKEIVIPEMIFTVVTTLLIYRFFLFTDRRLREMEDRNRNRRDG
ncbi:rod shape-determining protein MreD [Brotaphodocola sp.]|uniref:rod shape-determining protein MreD n=1 Tax=Brotaphodocola sp. TaxID=3073577 RepID=UPI003D7DC1DD